MVETVAACLVALVLYRLAAGFVKWCVGVAMLIAKRAKTEAELRRIIDEATRENQ